MRRILYYLPAAMPTQWQCNMCMEKQDEAYVSSVITAIGEELVKLEKGSEETCKSFIIKHSQNLHPNHFYLMDVKLALCQMLGKGGPEKNGGGAGGGGGGVEHAKEKELVLKQKLCMEILDVVNKISPGKREHKKTFFFFRALSQSFTGISRLRGVVLYELQSTLSIYARRKFNRGEISLQHLKNIMQASGQILLLMSVAFTKPLLFCTHSGSGQLLERMYSDLQLRAVVSPRRSAHGHRQARSGGSGNIYRQHRNRSGCHRGDDGSKGKQMKRA